MAIWEYFRGSFGSVVGFIRILLYPLTATATTPIRLVQTLWNCRTLWQRGDWSKVGGQLSPYGAFVLLAYSTYAMNFERFGSRGLSHLMGFGKFYMGSLWHYSLLSLYALKALGPIVPIMGMFAWLIGHVAWLPLVPWHQLLIVLAITLGSTSFYMSAFARQTYHPLGWLFFPIALAALFSQQYAIASLGFFLAGYFSITASVLIILWIGLVSLLSLDPMLWLLIVPNVLWLFFKMAICSKDLQGPFSFIFDMLTHTATKKDSRLKLFKKKLNKYGKQELLSFIVLYGQLLATLYFYNGFFSLPLICGLILLIVNDLHIFYLGDNYLCLVFHMSLAIASVMLSPSYPAYLSLCLFLSPMPFFLNMPPTSKSTANRVLDVVPVYQPVDINSIIEEVRTYLQCAGRGKKILALFPGEKLSQQWSEHQYLLQYVGTCENIHILPDQFARLDVIKQENSPPVDCSPQSAKAWMKRIKADYVIVDSDSTVMRENWANEGFSLVAAFDWRAHPQALEGWLGVNPPDKWLLLKNLNMMEREVSHTTQNSNPE